MSEELENDGAVWNDEIVVMARQFHDIYEEESARLGWPSQTPVPFDELPEANKQTMLCTVARIRSRISKGVYRELIDQINELELASLRARPQEPGDLNCDNFINVTCARCNEPIGHLSAPSGPQEPESESEWNPCSGSGCVGGLVTYYDPEIAMERSVICLQCGGSGRESQLEWRWDEDSDGVWICGLYDKDERLSDSEFCVEWMAFDEGTVGQHERWTVTTMPLAGQPIGPKFTDLDDAKSLAASLQSVLDGRPL